MSVQRRIRTYLDTWGIVIDNIENVDEAKENGDKETHPASNYLQICVETAFRYWGMQNNASTYFTCGGMMKEVQETSTNNPVNEF